MTRHLKYSPTSLFVVWIIVATFGLSSARGQVPTLPNGVACGDVTQTSAVLWAHSTALGEVTFDVSTLEDFTILEGHQTVAVVDVNQPVKVQITGLIPATRCYYRITDAQNGTAVGQFRTARDVGIRAGLRFGASGDWQQAPPFASLKNAPERDLDFFIKR